MTQEQYEVLMLATARLRRLRQDPLLDETTALVLVAQEYLLDYRQQHPDLIR